jgi:prophage maintenance system killer protein
MAAYTFLGLNGLTLTATEPDAYEMVDGVAAGRYSEEDAAEWLRAQCKPR